MAQFARPMEDTDNTGLYVNQVGASLNLFQSIDEAVLDNDDFIRSPNNPSNAVSTYKLNAVEDPAVSAGHIIRAYFKKDLTNPAQVDMRVELREGYTNEGSPGTLIATLDQVNVTTDFVEYTHILSEAEADAITDYSDLFARVITNPT